MSKVLMDEEELVESLKNGGAERKKALAQIYSTLGLKQRIKNYVLHLGGNDDEADDVLIESIIIVERNIRAGKFEGKSTIATYTYAVAKNYWSNKRRLRKNKLVELDEKHEHLSDYQNPELIFLDNEIKVKMIEIMKLLSEKCSKVLNLWCGGANYDEIAVELEIENSSSLRKIKYDCQKKLKSALLNNPELIPSYYHGDTGS